MTGTLAWLGYLAAAKKTGLFATIPMAPLESASWVPVTTAVGLVWSSIISGTSLWPCTPPAAFCWSRRARKPFWELAYSGEPGPVSELT